MQALEILRGAQGGGAIDNLAKTFGIDPAQAEAVVAQVAPELSYGMERNTLSRRGVAALIEELGSGRYSAYEQDAGTLDGTQIQSDGNRILGQLMRNKASSRRLAARTEAATGLSATIIKAMLPYIASILMGGLAKSTQGGLGDILKRLPQITGGRPAAGRPRANKTRDTQSGDSGGGFSLPLPRAEGGARTTSGGTFEGSPLPLPTADDLPQSGNPYSDIGDVLRRGGSGGSTLWKIARSLLAGILGFQSRGVIGWFVRMIVMRYGWRFVKAILGRVIGMR